MATNGERTATPSATMGVWGFPRYQGSSTEVAAPPDPKPASAAEASPPVKKRGRPRKYPVAPAEASTPKKPKKRGRPRKHPVDASSTMATPPPVKRGRGRPRKDPNAPPAKMSERSTEAAAAPPGPKYEIGTTFLRNFGGKDFQGKIVSFEMDEDNRNEYYHILYEDGDEEDLADYEIAQLLAANKEYAELLAASSVSPAKRGPGRPRKDAIGHPKAESAAEAPPSKRPCLPRKASPEARPMKYSLATGRAGVVMPKKKDAPKEKATPKKEDMPKTFTVGGSFLNAAEKAALEATAAAIATRGKGITACDESPGTIGGRFAAVGVENTEENRRKYRQMLFEAEGNDAYLSAAILDPETLYQTSDSGKSFPQVLTERGIVPGIKPHLKVYTLPGTGGDTVMQGLDSLAVRCQEYYKAGARFAKWRSPLTIDKSTGRPTDLAIRANMQDLARYALICQSEGLVPIVEPDVSLDGNHTLETAVDVNIRVQSELFKAMIDHGVYMAGSILKSNIVNPGRDCPESYTVEEIAEANVFVFEQCFPVAMKGANYLSGGLTLEDAAARLSAINRANKKGPWNLSFSFSQAFQLPLLELCKDKGGALPLEAMSKLYIEELRIASLASKGEYYFI